MLTRTEAERLAQAVHALRPSWPVASLMTFLQKRKDRAYLDLALELTFVALDPDTKSPARIDVDGPWKRLQHGSSEGPRYKQTAPGYCIVCGQGWALHSDPGEGSHDFENPLNEREGSKPTPEQRAEIDKAIEQAHKAMTAAKEEAAKKREPAAVEDVLARHQSNDETTEEVA